MLPDDAAFTAAYESLPGWRRRKAAALRFDADRRRSVAAWMLLRRLLVERGVDATSLPVTENACGKPAFAPHVGLRFNLSHAVGRVMAVVSEGEVGCDVEQITAVGDGMVRAALTAAERERVEALSGAERDSAFFRLWVRKESYVKAVGCGMSVEPSAFSALSSPPSPGWCWRDLDFGDGYLGCVCYGPGSVGMQMTF